MLVLLKVVLPVNMTFLKLILWNMQLKKVTSENVVKSIFPMLKKRFYKLHISNVIFENLHFLKVQLWKHRLSISYESKKKLLNSIPS